MVQYVCNFMYKVVLRQPSILDRGRESTTYCISETARWIESLGDRKKSVESSTRQACSKGNAVLGLVSSKPWGYMVKITKGLPELDDICRHLFACPQGVFPHRIGVRTGGRKEKEDDRRKARLKAIVSG